MGKAPLLFLWRPLPFCGILKMNSKSARKGAPALEYSLWQMYWWGVGLCAAATLLVRLTKERVYKKRDTRFYGPLPPRFFGPFSKGEWAGYLIQCFVTPTLIFLVFWLAEATPDDTIIYIIGIPYLIVWIEVIPTKVEQRIDRWGPKYSRPPKDGDQR